jgi:hypothetical protein
MINNVSIDKDGVNCSACDKYAPMDCMFMSVRQPPYPTKDIEGLKKSMGPYKLNETYHICYECAFKAMGISELRREDE